MKEWSAEENRKRAMWSAAEARGQAAAAKRPPRVSVYTLCWASGSYEGKRVAIQGIVRSVRMEEDKPIALLRGQSSATQCSVIIPISLPAALNLAWGSYVTVERTIEGVLFDGAYGVIRTK